MKKLLTALTLICMILVQPLAGYHIFWDMGNVLVYTDRFAMGKDLGFFNVLKYTTSDKKNPLQLLHLMQEVLKKFGTQQPTPDMPLVYVGNESGDKGDELAKISCDLFMGTIDYKTLKNHFVTLVEELFLENFFSSEIEKKLVLDLFDLIHEPGNIVRHRKVMHEGVALLKKIIANNTAGEHHLYILANWDKESFELLKNTKKFQELIGCFKPENIIISGDAGTLKPHRRMFEYVLEKYNLTPAECILIDDSKQNIDAANQVGFVGIQLQNGNFYEVEDQLRNLKVV